jgi:hypothetical protein
VASPLLAVPGGDYKIKWPFNLKIVLQDVQTFIDDQQGQIIITVVVECTTGVNVSCLPIAEHLEVETAGVVERESR